MGKKNQIKHILKKKAREKQKEGEKTNRSSLSKEDTEEKKSNYPFLRDMVIAVAGTVLAAFIIYLILGPEASEKTVKNIEGHIEKIDSMLDRYESNLSCFLPKIDEGEAGVLFQTGIKLYNEKQFESAASIFKDALSEQKKLTGADSDEVGIVFLMLGLSRLYAGNSITNNSDNVIIPLTSAQAIFEENDNQLMLAASYLYFATAYFEMGESYMNHAIENIRLWRNKINECLPSDVKVKVEKMDGDIIKPHVISENVESLYLFSKYLFWEQEGLDLTGRIYYRLGDYYHAFVLFNEALYSSVKKWVVDTSLASIDTNELSENIIVYIQDLDSNDVLNQSCSIYKNSDAETNSLGELQHIYLPISSQSATYLTNRAMSEISLGYPEEATIDCEDALKIWNRLPYSDRNNIAQTYINLSFAIIIDHIEEINTGAYPEEEKIILFNYLQSAVKADKEMFGEKHIRTAYSFETLGFAQMVFGDYESSSNSYQNANDIYREEGDTDNVKRIEAVLEMLASNPELIDGYLEIVHMSN